MELGKNNPVSWNYKDILTVLLVMELAAVAYSRWGVGFVQKIWISFFAQPINEVFIVIIGGFIQALLILLLVFLAVRGLHHDRPDQLGLTLRAPDWARILGSGIIGGVILLLVVAFTSLIVYALFHDLVPVEQQPVVIVISRAGTWQEITLLTLVVSILAPFSEEILFRGMIYGWLRQRLGIAAGIWLSGLIFGALHLDLIRLIPLMLGGAGLAYLYQRTGSLYTSIIAHAVWNSVMTLMVRWLGVSI